MCSLLDFVHRPIESAFNYTIQSSYIFNLYVKGGPGVAEPYILISTSLEDSSHFNQLQIAIHQNAAATGDDVMHCARINTLDCFYTVWYRLYHSNGSESYHEPFLTRASASLAYGTTKKRRAKDPGASSELQCIHMIRMTNIIS